MKCVLSFSRLLSASLAVFALGPVLGACSASSGSTTTDSPASATITDGDFDAGATCNQQEAQARAILDPLLDAATSDQSCTTDDDCVFVENGTACTPGCGVLVTAGNAPKVAAARQQVDCTAMLADGCAHDFTYSCPRNAQGGVCVANQCTSGITAAWTSLAITRGEGAAGGNAPSTTWTVTSDGLVTVDSADGGVTSVTLSATDFNTVDGILRSASFRQVEGDLGAPACTSDGGTASSGIAPTEDVAITRPSNTPSYNEDISACVAAGADANDFATIYAIVQRYH